MTAGVRGNHLWEPQLGLPTDSGDLGVDARSRVGLKWDSTGSTGTSLFNVRMWSSDSTDLEARVEEYIQRRVEEYGAVVVRQEADPRGRSPRVYAMPPSSVGGDSAFAWRFPMDCYESALKTGLSRRGPPLAALASIQTPTLAISGGTGTMPDGSSQLVGVLRKLTVRSIPGGGHDPWYTQPDLFFSIVSAFLRSHLD